MVKDTIDRDPKYVFYHPSVQSILLWLFQSQDDQKKQTMIPNIQQMIPKSTRIPKYDAKAFTGCQLQAASRTECSSHGTCAQPHRGGHQQNAKRCHGAHQR